MSHWLQASTTPEEQSDANFRESVTCGKKDMA